MRIFDQSPQTTTPHIPESLIVEHKGQTVAFLNARGSIRGLSIPNNTTSEKTFSYINTVFANLPEQNADSVFACYQEIRRLMTAVVDPAVLLTSIVKTVKQLYTYIPYEMCSDIIDRNIKIYTPPKVVDKYEDMEISERSKDYRSSTYVKQDYIDLAKLAIILKPMIPVWMEYMRSLDAISSRTTFRDLSGLAIITSTYIPELPSYKHLIAYIESSINTINSQSNRQYDTFSAVLGGLGSMELPQWLAARTIIRKLTLIELSTQEDANSVISIIYKNVESELSSLSRKFVAGGVRAKNKPSDKEGGDSDNEDKSLVECYKMQQERSDGDITPILHYSEKPLEVLAKKMTEHYGVIIPKDLLDDCLFESESVLSQTPTQEQLTILSWIIHPIIHVSSVNLIDRRGIARMMALSQAFLHVTGFSDLALLISARQCLDESGIPIGGVDGRQNISKATSAILMELFPYNQEKRNKSGERSNNVIYSMINNLAPKLMESDWVPSAPRTIKATNPQVDRVGVLVPPVNLRERIAQLIIFLDNHVV